MIERFEEDIAPPPSKASFIFKALGLCVVGIILLLAALTYFIDKGLLNGLG